MGLFDFLKKKTIRQDEVANYKTGIPKISGSARIIDQLEQSGYFKYSAVENIEELKKEIGRALIENHCLSTLFEEERPYYSKDYRHYPLDGEDLFEEGGFTDKLAEMQILFEKMNFKIAVSDHVEEWDGINDWLNHRITINEKEYTIFNNFKGYGWGEAAQKFAEILNDQLELQGMDERIYLANGGNDGRAVFLTSEQFALLDPILKHPSDRPLEISDWCRVMQVKPI